MIGHVYFVYRMLFQNAKNKIRKLSAIQQQGPSNSVTRVCLCNSHGESLATVGSGGCGCGR